MGEFKGTVAGIWSNYYPGSDGNPHEYLKENGWKSMLLTAEYLDDGNPVKDDIHFMDRIELNQKLKSNSLINRAYNKLNRLFYWKKFNRFCEDKIIENNVQLLHVHFGYTAVRILPLVKKLKIPMVITFYGVDGSQMIKDPKWVKGYKEMFAYATKLVVLCEEVKDRLVNLGCPPEKVVVWQIPIDLNVYKYKPRQPDEVVRFVIGARFVEKKGYPYLFKAFKKLIEEGRNVELTAVGYGTDKASIEALIEKENVGDKVTLIDTSLKPGFPTFFNEVLSQKDIFVLPSTSSKEGDDEGGPSLTLVAAQAAGLPVVCTDFPGAEITVFDGENGLFCLPENVDSLHGKMVQMIESQERWNEMGKKGSDYVHDLFQREKQMNRLLNIFEESI